MAQNGSGFGGCAYVHKSVIVWADVVPTVVCVFTYTAVLHIHT